MDAEAIASFMAVTGCEASATAQHYLEASGGDLNAAVAAYMDSDGAAPAAAPAAPAVASASAPGARPASRPAPARGVAGVRGFGDIGREGDESDDDENQDYYAGGEKSGQLVRAPKKDHKEAVTGLFDTARSLGARQGTADDLADRASAGAPFGGAAQTLSGAAVGGGGGSSAGQAGVPRYTITFFGNGVFTVNDGEARRVDDPANTDFLKHIMQGVVPPELESQDGSNVEVNLVRKEEDYEPPKYRAFTGTAAKLSDDAPSSSATPSGTAVTGTWSGVDESKPSTSVQIRLHDGSRLVARVNLDHTVADIRRFIAATRPEMPPAYRLMSGFPSKPLDDNDATIEAAGLVNSVVQQRM